MEGELGFEACDDGNSADDDDCVAGCVPAACGDGLVRLGIEGCDDGNTVTEECEYGLAECTVCAADCTEQAGETDVCGDGTVDDREGCDDGTIDGPIEGSDQGTTDGFWEG